MLKSFKTEMQPTEEQASIINRTIGTCRFVYNFYISHNKELYETNQPFMSGKDFSLWLNNVFLPANPGYSWIKSVSSKSVKKSMEDACAAFRKFFQKQTEFPRFKKKGKSDPKMYFVKNNPNDCLCERHRVKIPTLGWVRLKEKGYLPCSSSGIQIRSGTVSLKAGRYYVSVLAEIPDEKSTSGTSPPIGVDLGLKSLAVMSNGIIIQNVNKEPRVRKLEKKLKREQRRLSRKYEVLKNGGKSDRKNLEKQKLKVKKIHHMLKCIRTDHVNKAVHETVKTKPSHITIEDLNVSGMLKNRHLSKAIAAQKFFEFRLKLAMKCRENGIELRIADRFYPSSKICHTCGNVKHDLKLSDRVYCCPVCGCETDRDYNASLNLRDTTQYRLA